MLVIVGEYSPVIWSRASTTAFVMLDYLRFIILFWASYVITINPHGYQNHTSFLNLGNQSHVVSNPKDFTLFFLPKSASVPFPFGVRKKIMWDLVGCSALCLLLLCLFLNNSSSSAVDMKKLLTVTPLQESKQGSTRSGLANLFEGMCQNRP